MTNGPASAKPAAAPVSTERRTLRWLLGGQIALAVLLVLIELGPALPRLMAPSAAPELDLPVRPGDQTRRYRPGNPAHPGPSIDPDMPQRLLAQVVTDDTGTTVRLRGAIAPGDAERIRPLLVEAAPQIVNLDSPGGSVVDALDIGRTLRGLEAQTRVAADAVCLSACPYVFAGGSRRTLEEGGRIGVHQHSFGEATFLPVFLAIDDIQRGQAEVLDYLVEMEIDLRMMGPAMATPANEIYLLSAEELTEWRLVTE